MSRELTAYPPVHHSSVAPQYAWLLMLAALVMLFGIGQSVHPDVGLASGSVNEPAGAGSYSDQVASLLGRYDASVAQADRLLDERDGNTMLVESAAWTAAYTDVVAQLRAEYDSALALSAPQQAAGLQTCLTESLRLTSLGHSMLHDA